MKKSRFTETQIVEILRMQEKGLSVADICRDHGISQPTFYNWQRKYGGMEANELKRLKGNPSVNRVFFIPIARPYLAA